MGHLLYARQLFHFRSFILFFLLFFVLFFICTYKSKTQNELSQKRKENVTIEVHSEYLYKNNLLLFSIHEFLPFRNVLQINLAS